MIRRGCVILMMLVVLTTAAVPAGAEGSRAFKAAGASLLLPSAGQIVNGDGHTWKARTMQVAEVGAITTSVLIASLGGGGWVWAGLGPLIANHAWSAADAYLDAAHDPRLAERNQTDAAFYGEAARW